MNVTKLPRDTDQISDTIRSVAATATDRVDLDAVADSFGDLASSARHVAEDVASATSAAATSGGRSMANHVTRTVVTSASAARRHPRIVLSGAVAIAALIGVLWWLRRETDEADDAVAFPRAA